MRQVAKLALVVAAVGTLGVLVWEGGGHHSVAPPESGPGTKAVSPEVQEAESPNTKTTATVTSTEKTEGFRPRLKESKDYAALVRNVAAAASSGDHEAEYVTAEALKYCDDNLRRFFRKPGGGLRSLPEAQSKWANRPEGYRQEIGEIYERCHGFLDDDSLQTSSYSLWLDRAAAANYPPAVAEKADLSRASELLAAATATASGKTTAPSDPNGEGRAVWAATSGDPDALFLMQNWVRSDAHAGDDYENYVTAWRLVACQHGYDCGKDSDWMRSQCNFDPQCANDSTFEDYLRRRLADRYETVSDLAAKIDAALAAKDPVAVRALL